MLQLGSPLLSTPPGLASGGKGRGGGEGGKGQRLPGQRAAKGDWVWPPCRPPIFSPLQASFFWAPSYPPPLTPTPIAAPYQKGLLPTWGFPGISPSFGIKGFSGGGSCSDFDWRRWGEGEASLSGLTKKNTQTHTGTQRGPGVPCFGGYFLAFGVSGSQPCPDFPSLFFSHTNKPH